MGLEKLLFTNIKDIMSVHVHTVKEGETAGKTVQKMVEKKVGAIVIVDDQNKVLGIFSERDLLNESAKEGFDLTNTNITDVMTKNPTTVDIGITVAEAFNIFQLEAFRHLPVVDGDKLAGIVSVRDIDKFIYKLVAKELINKFDK